MNKVDERGLFQINFNKTTDFVYKLKITNDIGQVYVAEDTYRFSSFIGDIDEYLFAQGNHREIYKKLGAHLTEIDGVKGVAFAVWAPNAKRVSVVGNFNNWDGRINVMRKH
ncbi:MAG: 1,4-alpha-glucan branching enzyme, partial [Alphaproteobacteria bacterium]|nr:1,4-alpha-glucan branching enzyme [Alphaproteobacteria bacterium]